MMLQGFGCGHSKLAVFLQSMCKIGCNQCAKLAVFLQSMCKIGSISAINVQNWQYVCNQRAKLAILILASS